MKEILPVPPVFLSGSYCVYTIEGAAVSGAEDVHDTGAAQSEVNFIVYSSYTL